MALVEIELVLLLKSVLSKSRCWTMAQSQRDGGGVTTSLDIFNYFGS